MSEPTTGWKQVVRDRAVEPPAVEGGVAVSREVPFVGRARELAGCLDALASSRTVAIVGPGGVGKTALLRAVVAAGAGPVCVVDLTPARDAGDVVELVRAAVAVPPSVDLCAALARRGPLLLALDNAEQVADAVTAEAGRWVDAAPSLRVLLTSRRRLGFVDRELPLAPLAVDDAESPAVRLLLACVHRSRGRPASAEERPAAIRLAGVLEGLPLALCLAGARARVLSLDAILRRVESGDTLRVLGGAPGRHGSLRAAIRWTWALLPEPARRALAWLAVFRGGCDADAVQAVLGTPDDALALVELLLDHALVHAVPHASGEVRFAPYEVVRVFAREQLAARGRESAAIAAHRDWFLGERWRTLSAARRLADRHNLAAVFDRFVDTDPAVAARAVVAYPYRWADMGSLAVRAARLLDAPDRLPDPVRAKLHLIRGLTAYRCGRKDDAAPDLQAAARLARAAGLATVEGPARGSLAGVALSRCEWDAALEHTRVALEVGDLTEWSISVGALHQATALLGLGRMGEARETLRARLAVIDPGDRARGPVELGLAIVEIRAERWDRVDHHLTAGAAACADEPFGLSFVRRLQGARAHLAGDLAQARERYEQALALADHGGSQALCAILHASVAAIEREQGLDQAAVARFAEADAIAALHPHHRLLAAELALWRAHDDLARASRILEDDRRGPYARDPGLHHARLLLERRLRDAPVRALRVGPEGRWFQLGDGDRVDLSRRQAPRRLLHHLAAHRLDRPGATVCEDELFEAGWPGVTIRAASARHRLHVAISSLRRAGLGQRLQREGAGYRLDPTVPILLDVTGG